MNIEKINSNGIDIARVTCDEVIITDVQSALDFIATVRYETDCDRVIVDKSALPEEFFDLSTRLVGEVLQKFTQYRVALAIVGDFSGYTSESLRAFIRESNRGRHLFFAQTIEDAAERLSAV